MLWRNVVFVGVAASWIGTANAQVVSGSDGSDGALNISGGLQSRNLDLAAPALWNAPSPVPGQGVYDAARWAVVYKYSSVTINANSAVWFQRHRTNAPVVWLVQGNVTIDVNGGIVLNAGTPVFDNFWDANAAANRGTGGPGGWNAGYTSTVNVPAGHGFGPGGVGSGSYAEHAGAYNNPKILPLVGGSGAGGDSPDGAGRFISGGGGAILIVAGGTITVNGRIFANGSRFGSGGAIRLVASSVAGSGSLQAVQTAFGGTGSNGRIRIESPNISYTGGASAGSVSTFTSPNNPQIWPDNLTPTAEILQVGTTNAPADPNGSIEAPDLNIGGSGTYPVLVRCRNVPTGGTWQVRVRITPRNGNSQWVNATLTSGAQPESLWTAQVPVGEGASALQARANRL